MRLVAPAFTTVLVFLSVGRTVAAPAPEPLPTPAEIHQLYDEGKYPQVLQKLQRVLILKGDAAKPYDRHDLLRLRGETQLRLKSNAPAVQSFTEAAAATEDASAVAVDRATALLIKRSQQQQAYTPKNAPKGKTAGAIPIVDPASRKKAMGALFDDELAAAEPRLKAVADAKQLSVILDAVPFIRDLRSLELAATEKDERTRKVLGRLGAHARELLDTAVKDEAKKVDLIEKTANETVEIQDYGRDPKSNGRGAKIETLWKKRGLTRNDANNLRDSYTMMEKVATACHEMADVLGNGNTGNSVGDNGGGGAIGNGPGAAKGPGNAPGAATAPGNGPGAGNAPGNGPGPAAAAAAAGGGGAGAGRGAAAGAGAGAGGDKPVDFAPVRAEAEKVAKKADALLNTDYSRRYTRPPGN